MLIPKKDRKEIYKYLFKEGVLWAPKDYALAEHPEMKGISNLHVIKAMQSFESKEYVTARYAWRQHYWFLSDAGIEYLREYLNIPESVAPATLIRQTNRQPMERSGGGRDGGYGGGRGGGGGYGGSYGGGRGGGGGGWRDDRDDYRREGGGGYGGGRGGGDGGYGGGRGGGDGGYGGGRGGGDGGYGGGRGGGDKGGAPENYSPQFT